MPYYAGTRISELVTLDVDDVRLSARKGALRILGKGEKVRQVPIPRCDMPYRSGWTIGPIGPALTAQPCSSTGKEDDSRRPPPTTSSPTNDRRPALICQGRQSSGSLPTLLIPHAMPNFA
ncbi:hypothetical protein [Nonomuraea sp. SYSU D8015]|uniref:hypothetical protein n=1 Tax=Nonomuraea sp. SYSU D8015 TaxID=2593644 RepID=UPI003FA599A7